MLQIFLPKIWSSFMNLSIAFTNELTFFASKHIPVKLFNINQDDKKLESIDLIQFINHYNEEKKNYTNILCVKGKSINLSNTW